MDENKQTGEAASDLPEQLNIEAFPAEETEAAPEPESPVPEAQPAKSGKKPARRQSRLVRRIMAAILTILLVILAILVFVFREDLSGEGLRRIFGRENSVTPAREAFTYETGAEQVFAPAGDGLAVASSSSVQLLNAKGQTVFKQVVSFDVPAVFACEETALFCDLSGTEFIVAGMDGESRTLSSGDDSREIRTADMNASGWFTLVTEEPGYKGLVSVYNAACEKQYEWWSGAGYVLRAAVSPDNKTLGVLTVESEGTILRFFALNSETPLAEMTFSGTLVYDLSFVGNNTVRAVGDTGFYLISTNGTLRSNYDLGGRYLLEYDFGSESFTALFVSDYRGGGGGTLLTLDAQGKVLAEQALERDVVSLSASGKQLLVMTGGGLVLYDSGLVRQYANETLMTARRAILRPSGDILLLSAYSAERFSF